MLRKLIARHRRGCLALGLRIARASCVAIEVPDQEIWTITAFVKKLPSVRDDDFKAWTARH